MFALLWKLPQGISTLDITKGPKGFPHLLAVAQLISLPVIPRHFSLCLSLSRSHPPVQLVWRCIDCGLGGMNARILRHISDCRALPSNYFFLVHPLPFETRPVSRLPGP